MLNRTIFELQGGFKARLAVNLIGLAGALTAPVKHRLFWRACNAIGKILALTSESCVIEVWPESKFELLIGDPYWSRLMAKSYHYEADFEKVLFRLNALDFAFLDCGANFGYWSVFASSKLMRSRDVLAVEASRSTYTHLQRNAGLNQQRFRHVLLAISNQSGLQVAIEAPSGHAGARITSSQDKQASTDLITTITLDDLVLQYFQPTPQLILVKLDVEGQEIPAFQGAKTLIENSDPLFYYEDHGKDTTSEVTAFVLGTLGLRVFFCRDDGSIIAINSPQEASLLKTQKSVGYNFLACKPSSVFIPFLDTPQEAV